MTSVSGGAERTIRSGTPASPAVLMSSTVPFGISTPHWR